MTLRKTYAHIDPSCERASWWKEVYGSLEVPITSPVPVIAVGPDGKKAQYYMVNTQELSAEQLEKVAQFVSEKFDLPIDEVRTEIEVQGIPLLAEDLTVSFDARLVL